MRIINLSTLIVASISIPLYIALLGICVYYALKFWEVVQGRVEGGLYGTPKFAFFVVLGISALLDLPTFLACVGKGGPNECLWDHESYAFVWSCHLIATCGYLYAVITPSILWSDIIRQKDGNFWNSSSPLDGTKIFFRVAFIIYCCVIFTDVVGVIIYSKSNDESAYSSSNALGAINNCLMPIMLVVVTFGCFWSGMRLRQYVMNVQLGGAVQLRILLKLNFTMIVICASYTMRAILVMSLYEDIPRPYQQAMRGAWQYPVWLPLTQWVPFLLCSFCLVNEMKFNNAGKGSGGGGGSGSDTRDPSLSSAPRSSLPSPSVDVADPAYDARSKNLSVDSIFSDIARSLSASTANTSARSRSRYASRPGAGPGADPDADLDADNILMLALSGHGIAAGANGEGSNKARAASADNFFDAHDEEEMAIHDSSVGSDHFFTTSAMHVRGSVDSCSANCR